MPGYDERSHIREVFRKQRENYTPVDPKEFLDRMKPKIEFANDQFDNAKKRQSPVQWAK